VSAAGARSWLVIGGGRFVGRHLVDAALARGDAVTVFNRGLARSDWPAGVRVLTGDRQGDLGALAGGRWDAVIDTCAYRPAEVSRLAQALGERVQAYLLVSSISVYASFAQPNDETSPLAAIDDADTPTVDARSYGPLKALCEAALVQAVGAEQALVLRPGLIVGPHDPTERFTYWPVRIARAGAGEPVLVPGGPGDPVQFIDARDLAAFALDALHAGRRGVFNLTSPPQRWGEVLAAIARTAGTAPRWAWADAQQLAALGLAPWSDLPVWLPPQGDTAGMAHTAVQKALAAGLRLRALDETVADTLAWHAALPEAQRGFTKAGLTPEREAAALAALAKP
jgi:2'-hydroxyisoflavone reductase